ncbi:hypothetical protein MO973_07720 [Paenibacillus sp. TRM 82003]|nr:hypothetical protein [Paenibacillus sp. TRM 82003]
MANVEFDDSDPSKPFISKVSIERGEGTAGGAHSTAFVVFMDAAINAVSGKEFAPAVNALIQLCDDALELPNYKKASNVEKGKVDSKYNAIKSNALYTNPTSVSAIRQGSVVQNLIKEYILLRNSLPNTLIPGVSGVKGKKANKDEKHGAELMKGASEQLGQGAKNTGGKFSREFIGGVWNTFDERILNGIPTKPVGKYYDQVAAQLANHLMTCLQAYPDLPDDYQAAVLRGLVKKSLSSLKHLTTKTEGLLVQKIGDETGIDASS